MLFGSPTCNPQVEVGPRLPAWQGEMAPRMTQCVAQLPVDGACSCRSSRSHWLVGCCPGPLKLSSAGFFLRVSASSAKRFPASRQDTDETCHGARQDTERGSQA